MSVIGDRLKMLRYKRKIKIPTIISELNIARSTYTGYELGWRTPHGKSLGELGHILQTSVDYLVAVTNDDKAVPDYQEQIKKQEEIINKTQIIANQKRVS